MASSKSAETPTPGKTASTATKARGGGKSTGTGKATASKTTAKKTPAVAKASKPVTAAAESKAGKTGKTGKATTTRSTRSSTSQAGKTGKTGTRTRKTAGPVVTPEQRRHYIEVAAYYIAERRGFCDGSPQEDWARAEAEIDRLLAEGLLNITG